MRAAAHDRRQDQSHHSVRRQRPRRTLRRPRRQDERELMAMCADMGVGLIPYSPQAPVASPVLGVSSHTVPTSITWCKPSIHPLDEPVLNAVHQLAERAVGMAQIARPGCCATLPCLRPSSPPRDLTTCRRRPRPRSDRRRGRHNRTALHRPRPVLVLTSKSPSTTACCEGKAERPDPARWMRLPAELTLRAGRKHRFQTSPHCRRSAESQYGGTVRR